MRSNVCFVLFIPDYFKLWANIYELGNFTKKSGFLVSFKKFRSSDNPWDSIPTRYTWAGASSNHFLLSHTRWASTGFVTTWPQQVSEFATPTPKSMFFAPSFWTPTGFSLSHLVATYFTGLGRSVRDKRLNLKLINHIYTSHSLWKRILFCSLF